MKLHRWHLLHIVLHSKQPFFSLYCKFIPFQHHLVIIIVKLYHFKTIYCHQVHIYNFIIVNFHQILSDPMTGWPKCQLHIHNISAKQAHSHSTFHYWPTGQSQLQSVINIHNFCTFLTFQDPFVTCNNYWWHSHWNLLIYHFHLSGFLYIFMHMLSTIVFHLNDHCALYFNNFKTLLHCHSITFLCCCI